MEQFTVIEIPPTAEDREKDLYDFYQQFSEAEKGGHDKVVEKFYELFEQAKSDYKKMTELYVITNHKIWDSLQPDQSLARLYDNLWNKVGQWVDNHFTEDEFNYFYRVTD